MKSTKVPYGFELVDGQLVECVAEQLVIEAIKVMRDAGLSQRAIARQLKQKGLLARELIH